MDTISINTLNKRKKSGEKITCLTAYDATFSHLVSSNGVEVILVGDSLGMVLQGHNSTVPVTIEQMEYHTKMVCAGNQGALVIGDLPFMTYSSVDSALQNAAMLMRAGAHMVKLEGGQRLKHTIQRLSENGVPVCAHLGLLPQSINLHGVYKVQGEAEAEAQQIIDDALLIQQCGAKMLILECVPSALTAEITQALDIPVVGIGAGPNCDGQILVLYDMLGMTPGKKLKFTKNFMTESQEGIAGAIRQYVQSVKNIEFPAFEHSF